jgi:glycosyltransferase involved in cell wall biosynthesis
MINDIESQRCDKPDPPYFAGRIAIVMPFKNTKDADGNSLILRSAAVALNPTEMRGPNEIILLAIDDGATDGSRELLESIVQEHTRRLVILNGSGRGPAAARNVALEYIRSLDNTPEAFTHVAFCDSDDMWFPWHLARSLQAIDDGYDMVYSNVECENEKGEPLQIFGIPNPEEFDYELLKQGNYIFISTVVMKRECIDVGQFSEDAVPMEDWEYWLRVAAKYRVKHVHAKKPSIIYTWKSTGSYYTAEDSHAAKLRIQRKMNLQDPMNVEGWLSRAEGEFLAKNAEGRRCIEIGSYKGKSACFMAPKATSIVCIDTFKADNGGQTQMQSLTTYVDFARNTAHLNNVTPLIGMSQNVHQLLKNDEFDFIFIDSMHDYESVMNDVKNYLPKLKDGAVIMFHDYFERDWPGVVRCVNELFGGPDELVDTIAKVTVTAERRFDLAIKFAGMTSSVDTIPSNEPKLELTPDVSDFEKGSLDGKVIVIAPWAAKLPGMENAKNYQDWPEVVGMLRALGAYTIQVGVAGEKLVGCDEVILNAAPDKLLKILNACDTFVSVDSFFPHFAAYHNKKGVVIFSKSDPKIFGHSIHLNLLKSREYLRPDQFRWWRDVALDKSAFVTPNEVVAGVLEILKDAEIYTELPERK